MKEPIPIFDGGLALYYFGPDWWAKNSEFHPGGNFS